MTKRKQLIRAPSMKTFLKYADGISVHFELERKRINHEFVGRYIWKAHEPDQATVSGYICRWEGFETLAECIQDFIDFIEFKFKKVKAVK